MVKVAIVGILNTDLYDMMVKIGRALDVPVVYDPEMFEDEIQEILKEEVGMSAFVSAGNMFNAAGYAGWISQSIVDYCLNHIDHYTHVVWMVDMRDDPFVSAMNRWFECVFNEVKIDQPILIACIETPVEDIVRWVNGEYCCDE